MTGSEGDWKTYPTPGYIMQPDHCGSTKLGNKMTSSFFPPIGDSYVTSTVTDSLAASIF